MADAEGFVQLCEGLQKKIIEEGQGTASPFIGSTVHVHYTGRLENGDVFDSSRTKDPFQFNLGREQVIKGWDIGVATMKKGERCELLIAPELGYGPSGNPPKIPPGAILTFDVELLRWESEDIGPGKDGSILRDTLVKGVELENPSEGSQVQAHIVGEHEGRHFYDRDVIFIVGEASEAGLPDGLDTAIQRMCRGEKSIIHLKGTRQTYGASPPIEYQLPPNAPVSFTIFLKEYKKVTAHWQLSDDEKIKAAEEAKERGNDFLKQGKLKLALKKYQRIEELLEHRYSKDAPSEKRDALMVAAYLNMALAYSQLNEEVETVAACDKALKMDPKNVKALYRKGCAKLSFADFDEAVAIFTEIRHIEPNNKAAQQQILLCKQRSKEFEQSERRRYKRLFAKKSEAEPAQESTSKEIDADDPQPCTSAEHEA
ncbi:unnamed protein product, partial [Mesorhabditis spiculigera]